MSKIFLVLSLLSLNIEPMQRCLSLASKAKLVAQNSARQFAAQAAKSFDGKQTLSLGKKLAFASLAGITTGGITAQTYNFITEQNPENLGFGIFKTLKADGYSIQYIVEKASSNPELFELYKDEILAKLDQLSYYDIQKICNLSKEHSTWIATVVAKSNSVCIDNILFLAGSSPECYEILRDKTVRKFCTLSWRTYGYWSRRSKNHAIAIAMAARDLNVNNYYDLFFIIKNHHVACDVLKNQIIDSCDDRDLSVLCGISNEHAITLAYAAISKNIKDEAKLRAIAGSCQAAYDILHDKVKDMVNPIEKYFGSSENSQSTVYLKQKFVQLALWNSLDYYNDPRFDVVLKRESELNKSGYLCFYHGQASRFGFIEDLTSDFIQVLNRHNLVSSKLREDFLYIQNRPGFFSEDPRLAKDIYNSEFNNQQNLMNGNVQASRNLSVNAFLVGNLTEFSSSTVAYLKCNTNVNHLVPIKIKEEIFDKMNIPIDIFEKYEAQLADLKRKYEDVFRVGRLLQICIPKDKVDKFVYLSRPGAKKTTRKTMDGKYISTVSEFIEIATTTPERFSSNALDQGSECTIPLTLAGVLDPANGIKIFAYDAEPTDKKLYQEFLQEKDRLVKAIVKDVAQHESMKGKQYHLCCKAILKKFADKARVLGIEK